MFSPLIMTCDAGSVTREVSVVVAGGLQDFLPSTDVGTISSVAITLSLASEEPESSQEPEGGLQRTVLSSQGLVSSG